MTRARDLANLLDATGDVIADALDNAPPSQGKNLILNGAMQVAQRGTSNTGQTASAYTTCDRWRWSIGSLGTWTTRQSTDAPDGFANSLNAECTTADASPAANDSLFLYHAFEGADLQQLGYGTATAQSITISFWIKATKTGAFQVNWKNNSATRLISSVQTVNSANTWEYKTITFVGYTGGAITNNNNKQAQLEMWFDAGSNFRINPTDTSWAAINNGYSQAYGTNINLGDTVGNQVYITGVQLEVGSVATPFEHRSYGEELAACQRYYVKITSSASNDSFGIGVNEDTTRCFTHHAFPVPMRADPTALETTGTATDYEIRKPGTTVTCSVVPEFVRASEYGSLIRFIVSSGLTQGQGGQNRAANGNAFLAWSAEL